MTEIEGSGPHVAALSCNHNAAVSADNILFDSDQEAAAERLQALQERLKEGLANPDRRGLKLFKKRMRSGGGDKGPRGIYIHGGVGRGKSMLMDMFFDCATVVAKRRVHHHHFMQEAHSQINRDLVNGTRTGGDDGLANFAHQLAEHTRLLCFDDFHVTDIGDAMILGPLFEALIEAGVIIVMTSNRAPGALYENGINRARFEPFIDLIKARLELVELGGAIDYRTRFIKRSRLYHTPIGPASASELERIFSHLSDGIPAEPESFTIQGRTLTIARTARGVAVVSFEELCATALGAQDYIALQEAFHTLIMHDIPRMGPDNRNEAKRFVTLIDVLYEHRVNLICSAAVAPEALYAEGHGAFEFARTVSRLSEMQSASYIGQAHQL